VIVEIGSDVVARMAALARLELGAGEAARLAGELNDIIAHVDALGEVDVSGSDAIGDVVTDAAGPRGDVPGHDALRAPLARFAPAAEAGFFTVPRLAAVDADAPEQE
jgi:aspartyl-tRNA(Asn)/glutamyl-tRNA(Gln) amidotransferase subunit C